MHYRKDIQILRGIAVILVVLFHLQIGGVKSGFLGVDVFFVISGFLMAILYSPEDKGKFFRRRAKRLLPTYFAVIFLALLVSIFMTIPNEYNQVVKQSIYASLFSSNIGFWMQNSYFSKAEFNPLLHLWSLGVEIQFYLIVPILAWFFRKSKIFLPLILISSLLLSAIIVGVSPKTSFFMMPLRLWEFLIGYGIAIYFTDSGNIKYNSFKWIGLIAAFLLFAIPYFNVDGETLGFVHGHPGLSALIVSIATGAVLAFGIPKVIEKSKIGTSFEILGKYSYSIYLVHFPVIVLFLYQPFSGTILKTNNYTQTIVLIFIIAILSILMYRFVEDPARHSKKIFRYILISIPIILIVGFLGTKIQQSIYSPEEQKIFNAWEDRATYRCGKLIRVLHPSVISCNLTTDIETPFKKVFLVGNSHADSIKSTFVSIAKKNNISVLFAVSNNPLMKGSKIQPKDIIRDAVSNEVDAIVLHFSPNVIKIKTIKKLTELATGHNIKVSFIMPVPVWEEHIPKVLFNHLENNISLPVQTRDDYTELHKKFYNKLMTIENLSVYTIDTLLCKPDCKIQSNDGKPYYFDTGHLTITGSMELGEVFESIFSDIK